jgi:hypothetical protein
MKRTQSSNELNMNNNENKKKKKNKKKNKSSLTLNELVHASNNPPTINQSYSDIDYFPMMPGALSRSNNHDKISNDRGKNNLINSLSFNIFPFNRFII